MNRIQIIDSSLLDFESSISSDNTELDMIIHAKNSFRPEVHKCQGCGCIGNCVKSVSYKRYLITPENYNSTDPDDKLITIDCYFCDTCNYTHANLYDPIIPYSSYSLLFILHVLKDYANHKASLTTDRKGTSPTIEKLCQKWGISISTLYRWKNLFSHHYRLWCIAICLRLKLKEQIDQVMASFDFVKDFFLKTSFSFLQPNQKTHAHRIQGLYRALPPPFK